MNLNALRSRKTRLGLALALGGGLLGLSAYQNTGFHRQVNAWIDSTLTEAQKRLPENALKGLAVAPGLEVRTVATEPMLTNPTNLDVDERGRIWVCEAYNYRPAINGNPTNPKGDRIVILQDTNGDGRADASKVFYQGPEINAPLGVHVLPKGRVIVSQSPYVWLFTDENGDDVADKKEILFEGIDGEQHDHGMHTFVFGPDGKYYFNFGNAGDQLKDRDGKFVKDQDGRDISKLNYKQGLVFRCDPDFRNVEVLGQNFRNNYEVAVDSYGTMWQSDNDDDGNKGVRINYVMDYGNYGYTDEMTGAGWQANRTNLEAEIPKRHWHLNDPGVVPNLLQTGAGSPTGILVYEGTLLPRQFQNQLIHCDAGPNVVRSYPVQNDGAGYKAEIVNVLKGENDQWFRPADVCAAPDGSLIVADWYDPGVGGHQAGDQQRGRVYRVAPPNTPYTVPTFDFKTPAGAVAALQNPNVVVRHHAWEALMALGTSAVPDLEKLWKSGENPRMRARAFWVLAKMPSGKKYVDEAVNDPNPNLRMAGLRAARQLHLNVTGYVARLVNDPDPQVRRECALALHHDKAPEAADLWATLASQHDGKDRWYLEALGIGAADQWDRFFAAYAKKHANLTDGLAARDIVWRARTDEAVPVLAKLATEPGVDLKDRLRYFRAMDFNKGPAKSRALLALLNGTAPDQADVNKLALKHLDPQAVATSPVAQKALAGLLNQVYGTPEYIELVTRYESKTENPRLLQLALAKSQESLGKDASGLLLKMGGAPLVWGVINGKDAAKAGQMVSALRWVGSKESLDILQTVALSPKYAMPLRRQASEMIGQSWDGESRVLALLKEKKVPEELIASTVAGVSRAWRKSVRNEAASYLPGAKATAGKKLPPVSELLAMTGDAKNGAAVFKQNCAICHQVNGEGMDFGPKLSEIGSKLPKEGQYLAILHPSAGISFGYEGWELKMKDGSTLTGIISSKTETDIDLKYPGGGTQRVKTADVKSMKQLPESMMPSGLQEAMSTQELVDLVEYLASLKKK